MGAIFYGLNDFVTKIQRVRIPAFFLHYKIWHPISTVTKKDHDQKDTIYRIISH